MWLGLVKAVIEVTNRKDTEVWQMAAVDFFAWVAYLKMEAKRQEQELNKLNKLKNKH